MSKKESRWRNDADMTALKRESFWSEWTGDLKHLCLRTGVSDFEAFLSDVCVSVLSKVLEPMNVYLRDSTRSWTVHLHVGHYRSMCGHLAEFYPERVLKYREKLCDECWRALGLRIRTSFVDEIREVERLVDPRIRGYRQARKRGG